MSSASENTNKSKNRMKVKLYKPIPAQNIRSNQYFQLNNKQSSNPINSDNINKYLVLAHGAIVTGNTFIVPNNINFITLTGTNEAIAMHSHIDEQIQAFYNRGYFIFDNNDLSPNISENGERLLSYLKQRIDPRIRFKNHLSTSIANEMILNFTKTGSTEGQETGIGIIELPTHISQQGKNKKNLYNMRNDSKFIIKKILLSELLSMFHDKYKATGRKFTFIIRACRKWNKSIVTNEARLLARTVSGTQGNMTPISGRHNKLSSN